jgi:hypothetical protein
MKDATLDFAQWLHNARPLSALPLKADRKTTPGPNWMGHTMSALGQKGTLRTHSGDVRFTPKADIGTQSRNVRFVPILLQKSVEGCWLSDSVAVKQFATGASDDGAAQSRSGTAFLFISA